MTIRPAVTVLGVAVLIIVGIGGYQFLSERGQDPARLEGSPGGVRAGASPEAVTTPEAAPIVPDLADIVVTNQNAPQGWQVEATLRGLAALDYLIRYGRVGPATPGFLDGRATNFCAEGEGCGTSWIALYASEADAEAAFPVFHGEMQVGWGLGPHAEPLGFGQDEARAYTNNLGNAAANHAYVWRKGSVLMGMIGVGEMEVATLRSLAEEMNARSR